MHAPLPLHNGPSKGPSSARRRETAAGGHGIGRHRPIPAALLLWLIWCLLTGGPAAAGIRPCYFFYYDPDSPQTNLANLKATMDAFLAATKRDILFQPFAHLSDFERNVQGRRPAFLLVPAWYLESQGERLGLTPLLRPLRDGRPVYAKVLLARPHPAPLLQEEHLSLATTSLGPAAAPRLNALLFRKLELDAGRMNIVLVPKGSDALFALTLGQVDLALVAKTTYEFIVNRNPALARETTILAVSRPLSLPILCYAVERVTKNEATTFADLFLRQRNDRYGQRLLEMLHFDGWEKVH